MRAIYYVHFNLKVFFFKILFDVLMWMCLKDLQMISHCSPSNGDKNIFSIQKMSKPFMFLGHLSTFFNIIALKKKVQHFLLYRRPLSHFQKSTDGPYKRLVEQIFWATLTDLQFRAHWEVSDLLQKRAKLVNSNSHNCLCSRLASSTKHIATPWAVHLFNSRNHGCSQRS